jgi:hypothetical protein
MTDAPKDAPAETPMQRALRMKKAALEAQPKAPTNGKFSPKSAAGVTAGASKPWMKK